METQAATQVPATAEELKPVTPTIDQIVEEYCDEQRDQVKTWTNVFAECIQNNVVEVHTEAQASEIARLMNQADSEVERVQAIADAMVKRAQARVSNLEFLFKTPLEVWTSAKLAGKKTRSIILPGGKLGLRNVPESTKYLDKDATLAWAQKNCVGAVKLVPSLETDKILEWESVTQQAAPGRVKTPAHDSFTVSVPKLK